MNYELLNIQQLSERIGVKVSTIYAWVNQRKIPYFKLGHLLKFDVKKIDEWIAQQEVDEDRLFP